MAKWNFSRKDLHGKSSIGQHCLATVWPVRQGQKQECVRVPQLKPDCTTEAMEVVSIPVY